MLMVSRWGMATLGLDRCLCQSLAFPGTLASHAATEAKQARLAAAVPTPARAPGQASALDTPLEPAGASASSGAAWAGGVCMAGICRGCAAPVGWGTPGYE